MILDLPTMMGLAQTCAPDVSPQTLLAVAHVESRFDTLAIGVNRGGPVPSTPTTPAAAARIARTLIASGQNIDLGLGQINATNLTWLGLTVEDAFDPCRNLAAAGRVLAVNYRALDTDRFDVQSRLRRALSLYNTGDSQRGFYNGYVTKVEAAAAKLGPSIQKLLRDPPPAVLKPTPPATRDVFAAPSDALVFERSAQAPASPPQGARP